MSNNNLASDIVMIFSCDIHRRYIYMYPQYPPQNIKTSETDFYVVLSCKYNTYHFH